MLVSADYSLTGSYQKKATKFQMVSSVVVELEHNSKSVAMLTGREVSWEISPTWLIDENKSIIEHKKHRKNKPGSSGSADDRGV